MNAHTWPKTIRAVPDPDLEIMEGGGGQSSRPLEKGGVQVSQKLFLALQASVWSKNKWGRGRGGGASPSLASTTAGKKCILKMKMLKYTIIWLTFTKD